MPKGMVDDKYLVQAMGPMMTLGLCSKCGEATLNRLSEDMASGFTCDFCGEVNSSPASYRMLEVKEVNFREEPFGRLALTHVFRAWGNQTQEVHDA